MPVNEWTHLVSIFDNGTCKLYKNGIYIGEKTGQSAFNTDATWTGVGRETYAGGYFGFNGCINDLRIYDHCLSAAEVKEIAQGLVLHYKLDGFFGGAGENLVINGDARNGLTGWSNWGTASSRQVIPVNNKKWFTFKTDVNGNYGGFSQDRGIALYKPNTQYTISALMYASANASGRLWVHTRSTEGGANLAQYLTTVNVTTSPALYTFTFNTGTNTSYTINKLNLMIGAVNTTSALDFYISDIKIEEGIKATFWVPCKEESGYDTTKIEDSSGYNHNGALADAAIVTSETPRYNVSTHFSANNQYIHVSNLTTSGFGSTYTFAWWEKRATYSNTMAWGFQNGIRLNGLYNGNLWNTGDGSNNPLYKPGTTTAVTVPTVNVWHHFAMVADGSTCKVYQDGELWAQAKTFKQISGTNLYINGWDSGTSYKSTDMSISDFRLYATPLLDTDIKQLYNVGMKVDKGQNIHAFEFNEQNENLFSSIPWTTSYGTHSKTSNLFTNFNSNGEPQFTANSTSAGSDYITITPGIYEYDYTISVNTGNQFYIGFERYDANKTSRSNAATVYTYSTKPTANIVKQRYKGTINLSTDGVNPIKYIALRILNGWSGTTSGVVGQATIHNFSLKLQSTAIDHSLNKQGRLLGGEYKEYSKASLYKDHIIEANQIIEK